MHSNPLTSAEIISLTGYNIPQGRFIASPSLVNGKNLGADDSMKENYYSYLSGTINNTMDEYVLAYMPTTNNQSVNGIISIKEI